MVFSCVDSRVPPEIVFDRGLGDLFVIRTAGHVVDDAALGSIEFGAEELHIPLVLVLGHERCGAVAATLDAIEAGARPHGRIGAIVDGIQPAVTEVQGYPGDILDNAVRANIRLTILRLEESAILGGARQAGQLRIVGGRYDLDTGEVEITVP